MTNEASNIDLPEGIELISDGTLTGSHDFEKNPLVHGKVLVTKSVPIKRGNRFEPNRLITVQNGDEVVAVWESAGLKDLFDKVVEGDIVYIKYDGKIEMGPGREDMKKFITGLNPVGKRDSAPA